MKTFRRIILVPLVCVFIAGIAYAVFERGHQPQRTGRGGNSDGPVPVLATQSRVDDVPVYINGVGTMRALNMVVVRSQVNGTLIKVNFKEGQDVKRGDVLALIDPTTYQAQLDQAVAKKALDEAQLGNAKIDLQRYITLAKTNAVTQQQADTQKALVNQLEAQVKLDQGAIDNAQAFLNWCTITSPLEGRLGIRLVDEGNLVNTGDASGIVVVTQIQPIAALFNLPQQDLGRVNAAFARGSITVDTIDSDSQTVLDTGKLTVVNNQVDQTTGTVQMKAEFPNAKLQLWPGQFVNIRLLIDTLHQVVVVPTAAVQRGPNGTFVYVVQPDDTVSLRPVVVGQQDELQAVIARGVQPSERVVTSGFVQLADKRKVAVTSADQQPSGPGSRPRGNGERRGNARNQSSDATPNGQPSTSQ
ncbi:MAG TPA: efflux RND transporter periplasmic adaptor subunit [Xanthobacteraceae bacterium]|jgi:multidrug efflux system membrane fusion protein|nr:efflux RND transporter periplasmic adaptor subunit [Xanthobacteraceae bacterium]